MTVPTRKQLAAVCGNDPSLVQALEQLFQAVDTNTAAIGTGTAATSGLQNATFLTLSANDALENERIIEAGQGITLADTGAALVIALAYRIVTNGSYRLRFNMNFDADLNVEQSGTLLVGEMDASYANDAAAAAGGVPVGGLYHRSDGSVWCRLS